ncbi:TPA: hypothetical protein HMV45_25905 [Escherichia coli]|nr:hypothetical protein [Escherichia coli]
MIALNAFKRYAQCDVMVNTEYFNCGPLLYISVVCPRGEALLLTSPVRKLRNRIAHHEPILNRNLEDDFATIKRIITYRCQHSLEWMLKNQVLLPLLTLKPL